MAISYDKTKERYVATIGSGKLRTRFKKTFKLKRDAEHWYHEQSHEKKSPENQCAFGPNTLLEDMVTQYVSSLNETTPNQHVDVARGIGIVLKYLNISQFRELNIKIVHRFRNNETLSPRTINKYLGFMKSMCSHLEMEGWILNDPLRHLKKKQSMARKRRALDKTETEELLNPSFPLI